MHRRKRGSSILRQLGTLPPLAKPELHGPAGSHSPRLPAGPHFVRPYSTRMPTMQVSSSVSDLLYVRSRSS